MVTAGPDLLSPSDGFGFGGIGRMGGLGPGASTASADYKMWWTPEEPVSGQPTNFAMVGQDLSVRVPIYRRADSRFPKTSGTSSSAGRIAINSTMGGWASLAVAWERTGTSLLNHANLLAI
jgi:hypothetical protein